MTTTTPASQTTAGRLLARRPILVSSALLVGGSWLSHLAARAVGLPPEAGILGSLLVFLVVPLAVSAVLGGRREVRGLLRRLVQWRFAPRWWLASLVALPVLTVGVALATGTYRAPAAGWPAEIAAYAVMGLLVLGVTGNVVEEMAWGGLVQTRLMERHGLVIGSFLTSVPFALAHVPLAFAGQDAGTVDWAAVGLSLAVTTAVAPIMRYVLGSVLLGSGGSVLAIAAMHASFNAAGKLSVLDGWWQYVVALSLLALAMALHQLLRRPARVS